MVDGLLSRHESEGQPVMPRLRVLELADVEWEGVIEDTGDKFHTKLLRVLQERHQAGIGPGVLCVPDIAALRELSCWNALQEIVRVEGTAAPA